MRTLITVREPAGESRPLILDGALFGDPDGGAIDRELDTAGLFAVPGLADCHAHLGMKTVDEGGSLTDAEMRANIVEHAWMQVQGGVLLVLDKGSGSDVTLEILDTDQNRRPELQMAGRIIAAPGGFYPDYAAETDDAGLAEAVRSATATTASWVKVIGDWPRRGAGPLPNFAEASLRSAVEIAHAAGARVAVHTMAPGVPSMAVRAGVDSIEHGLYLDPDDLPTLAEVDGAWVPTVVNTESIIRFLGPDSSGGRLLSTGLANVRELLPLAEQLGVTILTGTDLAVPHGAVAAEAVKLREYGLGPDAMLAAATTAAYDYAGIDRGFAPGKRADAVFVRDDPRERPETLLDPALVVRRGTVVRPAPER